MRIRLRPINLGVSRWINAKIEIRSGWMNLLSLNKGPVGPPSFNYKITDTGDYTIAGDGVSQVQIS